MNFEISKDDDLAIFHLKDSHLDTTNSANVKAEFLILCQTDISVLIVDLSSVEFCDSSGLGALLLAERQMRENDGGIMVVDPIGKVKELIEISKLYELIPVYPTVEKAKADLVE